MLEEHKGSKQIIFLCGSSSDGKSELLSHRYDHFKNDYVFHFDATHRFKPNQNAIEALDELFEKYADSDKLLVIGINIGMMFNYLNSGAEQHDLVKDAIGRFINGEREFDHFSFFRFEENPKFSFAAGEIVSEYV